MMMKQMEKLKFYALASFIKYCRLVAKLFTFYFGYFILNIVNRFSNIIIYIILEFMRYCLILFKVIVLNYI